MITAKQVKGSKNCEVHIAGTVSKEEPLKELSAIVVAMLTRYEEDDIFKAVAEGLAIYSEMGGK